MNVQPAQLLRLISDFFSQIPHSGIGNLSQARARCQIVDNLYETVPRVAVDRVMKGNPLMIPPGGGIATELTDCDDYALQMKALMTALARQNNFANGTNTPPPAIGMVFTAGHAVNLFVSSRGSAGLVLLILDASDPQQPITEDPLTATPILKLLPVSLIYI